MKSPLPRNVKKRSRENENEEGGAAIVGNDTFKVWRTLQPLLMPIASATIHMHREKETLQKSKESSSAPIEFYIDWKDLAQYKVLHYVASIRRRREGWGRPQHSAVLV